MAMPSIAPLCKVYVDAICGRAIFVHSGLDNSRTHFGLERLHLSDLITTLWFARPTHAGLVLLRCVEDFKAVGAMRANGWVDLPPAEVIYKIKAEAAALGARWQTESAQSERAAGTNRR